MGRGYYVVSAGASGAIFGVVGGLVYAVAVNRGRLEDLSTQQLMILVAVTLYHGFTSTGVDNAAHVGGLLIGIFSGDDFYRKPGKIKDAYIMQKIRRVKMTDSNCIFAKLQEGKYHRPRYMRIQNFG